MTLSHNNVTRWPIIWLWLLYDISVSRHYKVDILPSVTRRHRSDMTWNLLKGALNPMQSKRSMDLNALTWMRRTMKVHVLRIPSLVKISSVLSEKIWKLKNEEWMNEQATTTDKVGSVKFTWQETGRWMDNYIPLISGG